MTAFGCCDWHVRCRNCGQAAIWQTHHQAWTWVKAHVCPPTQPNPTEGAA